MQALIKKAILDLGLLSPWHRSRFGGRSRFEGLAEEECLIRLTDAILVQVICFRNPNLCATAARSQLASQTIQQKGQNKLLRLPD